MALPPITALPTAPSRGQDSDTFNANADAFVAALPGFRTELNAFGQAVVDATVAASAAANYSATSTSSLTVGTGSRTFAIQTGKLFVVGQYVIAASAADPTKWVHGQVTAHNSTTGSLTVSVGTINGTGTVNDWSIGLTGPIPPLSWQTIGTLATTSGTPFDFTGIPTTYSDLLLVLEGVSHNSAGSTTLNLFLSPDGTTWASAGTIAAAAGATVSWYGGILIRGYNENAGSLDGAVENLTSSPSAAAASQANSRAWRVSGGIKGVRLSIAAGTADAGQVTLKGKR